MLKWSVRSCREKSCTRCRIIEIINHLLDFWSAARLTSVFKRFSGFHQCQPVFAYWFLFNPHEQHVDLCCQSCMAHRRSNLLVRKDRDVWHYLATCQPTSFLFAALISDINSYHFTPLSVIWTVTMGHKLNGKRNLLALFLALFSADQNEI